MFEVTITEIRKRKIYVDEDYDFQAYDYAQRMYKDNVIKLDKDCVVDVTYDVEVLD